MTGMGPHAFSTLNRILGVRHMAPEVACHVGDGSVMDSEYRILSRINFLYTSIGRCMHQQGHWHAHDIRNLSLDGDCCLLGAARWLLAELACDR